MKRLRLYILPLILLFLAGCTAFPLAPASENADVKMPDAAVSYIAPERDGSSEETARVSLYFLSQARQQLVCVVRNIRVAEGETLYTKTLRRLFEAPQTQGLSSVAPEGLNVLSLEDNGAGTLTVDLSYEALSLSAQELSWLRLAIVQTLTEFPGVKYVNILIGGRDEASLSVPIGALSRTDDSLAAHWAQLQADEERALGSEITRDVALYFPSDYGALLLSETRTLRFSGGNFILPVIEALASGPMGNPRAVRALPQGGFLAKEGVEISADRDGRRLILLHVQNNLVETLAAQHINFEAMCASLAYTLCRFVPKTDGIMLYAGDVSLTKQPITVSDYAGRAGHLTTVYFANAQGGLSASRRALDQYSALSARALLETILAGPDVYDGGLLPVFPKGMTAADILSVYTEGDTALVNLSANFYRLCQSLTPNEEKLLVYAMVNTLTGMHNVKQVQFFIDGDAVETLAGTIFIKGALMRNPGIIS